MRAALKTYLGWAVVYGFIGWLYVLLYTFAFYEKVKGEKNGN